MGLKSKLEGIVYNTVNVPASKDASVEKIMEMFRAEILLAYSQGVVDGAEYINSESEIGWEPSPEDYLSSRLQ